MGERKPADDIREDRPTGWAEVVTAAVPQTAGKPRNGPDADISDPRCHGMAVLLAGGQPAHDLQTLDADFEKAVIGGAIRADGR